MSLSLLGKMGTFRLGLERVALDRRLSFVQCFPRAVPSRDRVPSMVMTLQQHDGSVETQQSGIRSEVHPQLPGPETVGAHVAAEPSGPAPCAYAVAERVARVLSEADTG